MLPGGYSTDATRLAANVTLSNYLRHVIMSIPLSGRLERGSTLRVPAGVNTHHVEVSV